jgi:hypothetical protein
MPSFAMSPAQGGVAIVNQVPQNIAVDLLV